MPTTGALRCRSAAEPWKGALKAKTPPSAATSQYPPVARSTAMPTIGCVERGAGQRAVAGGRTEGGDVTGPVHLVVAGAVVEGGTAHHRARGQVARAGRGDRTGGGRPGAGQRLEPQVGVGRHLGGTGHADPATGDGLQRLDGAVVLGLLDGGQALGRGHRDHDDVPPLRLVTVAGGQQVVVGRQRHVVERRRVRHPEGRGQQRQVDRGRVVDAGDHRRGTACRPPGGSSTAGPGCTAGRSGRWSPWGSGASGRTRPGGTEVGSAPASQPVDECTVPGGRAAVERLRVEGVDVLAVDPVVADADVLAVRRGGAAVVLQVVDGRARLHLAGRRGGRGRWRRPGPGGRWPSGRRPGRPAPCRPAPGRTGRRWWAPTTALEAADGGVDGRHAGQRGEGGRIGGGDDLDVPPLGQPAVAGPDHVVVGRDRARCTGSTATGYPGARRRWPTGRWSADGRCRWPWPCTGWPARWRTAAPGCTACHRGSCCRSRSRRVTVRSGRRDDGPAADFAAGGGVGGDGGVAVVVLRVEEVDVGAVVVAVGLADLTAGRGVVAAVVAQRVDGRARVTRRRHHGGTSPQRTRRGGRPYAPVRPPANVSRRTSEPRAMPPLSVVVCVNVPVKWITLSGRHVDDVSHGYWGLRRSHPRMSRQPCKENSTQVTDY